MEIPVRTERRVIVQEHLEILADDEHVEQLLVHDLEIRDLPVLPGIVNLKCEIRPLAGLNRPRSYI